MKSFAAQSGENGNLIWCSSGQHWALRQSRTLTERRMNETDEWIMTWHLVALVRLWSMNPNVNGFALPFISISMEIRPNQQPLSSQWAISRI